LHGEEGNIARAEPKAKQRLVLATYIRTYQIITVGDGDGLVTATVDGGGVGGGGGGDGSIGGGDNAEFTMVVHYMMGTTSYFYHFSFLFCHFHSVYDVFPFLVSPVLYLPGFL
jgi:hypothetical protein